METPTAHTAAAAAQATAPRPSRGRRWGVGVVAVAAVAATLTACGTTETTASSPSGVHASMSMAAATQGPQAQLYSAMQNLWAQHMEWTYAAIAAFAADSKGFDDTATRLLKNQSDIGEALKPYYGEAAGDEVTKLLEEHIAAVVEVLKAAKADDKPALDKALAGAYGNADQIADFLSKANPDNWPQAEMREMMKGHIDQTVVYAGDQLTGKYAASISTYDEAESHMLEMANMLSAGIIKQFPDKFQN